jgi:DNA modification methylase
VANLRTNLLYFGDNLTWLRDTNRFPDESVDLVYLDPPFNSNRNYNVLFKEDDVRESEAQMHAFEDTWAWDKEGRVQDVFNDFVMEAPQKAGDMLKALVAALGRNDVTAYLTMMAPRLLELHRVLKPTGSLYLHCDPTASHYLKVLLDGLFGARFFRNEIAWKRFSAKNDPNRYGRNHDVLLFYTKGPKFRWNPEYGPFEDDYVDENYRYIDDVTGRRYRLSDLTANKAGGDVDYEWHGVRPYRGRHWAFSRENMDRMLQEGRIVFRRTGMPVYKRYLDEMPGVPLQDIWTDIRLHAGSRERLGYPTQKPLALLERIVAASSDPGDLVLDPFCGCGTAIHAAQKLGRSWIGIDVTPLATDLIRRRLEDAFSGLKVPIEGWPVDYAGAKALADMPDKYYFQDWAVIQAGGRPAGGERKKGADRGVDGVVPFLDGAAGPRRGIISVKAGGTGPKDVRDLAGVVSRDGEASFGVLITLDPPTRAMVQEALAHGTWQADFDGRDYPVIQLLSAQELIDGGRPRFPPRAATPTTARAQREREGKQGRLVD